MRLICFLSTRLKLLLRALHPLHSLEGERKSNISQITNILHVLRLTQYLEGFHTYGSSLIFPTFTKHPSALCEGRVSIQMMRRLRAVQEWTESHYFSASQGIYSKAALLPRMGIQSIHSMYRMDKWAESGKGLLRRTRLIGARRKMFSSRPFYIST